MKKYISSEQIRVSLANTPQITFEVTDACNLNCKYCGYGELYNNYDSREGRMLSVERAILFLNYMNNLWHSPLNMSFSSLFYISFYGGEPLMNMPFIIRLVDYCEKQMRQGYRKICFSMTTNALLLDRYMDYLVAHDFHLLISLDGNEYSNSYRVDKSGQPVYSQIISRVNLLRERYPDYFKKNVNFNAVLHNRNSVDSIYTFFKENYDKIPSIGDLSNVGIRTEKQEDFNRMYCNSTDSLYQSENYTEIERNMFMASPTYRSAALYLHQYSNFVYKDYNELLYGKPDEIERIPTGTCIPFSKKVFITTNGTILPCERISQEYGIGNISEERICLNFDYIATKYNTYFAKIENQCRGCKIRKACIQCVFNISDISSDIIKCHGYMNQKQFDSYRNTQLGFLYSHPGAYWKIMKKAVTE